MSLTIVKFIKDSIIPTSKLLYRDYIQLNSLQCSNKKHSFCQQAINRTKENIGEKLLTRHNMNITFSDEDRSKYDETENKKLTCFINPLEGYNNFINAIPNFSIVIYLQDTRNNISICVIDFPASNETLFAINSTGAFFESNKEYKTYTKKLKISPGIKKTNINGKIISFEGEINQLLEHENLIEKDSNIRIFGSKTFAANLVFNNKINKTILLNNDIPTFKAISLISKEYGCKIKKINDKSKDIIISNE